MAVNGLMLFFRQYALVCLVGFNVVWLSQNDWRAVVGVSVASLLGFFNIRGISSARRKYSDCFLYVIGSAGGVVTVMLISFN